MSNLTTLVTFQGSNGAQPLGSLIADAKGDLFGTTSRGGASAGVGGTVFEIAKTTSGYANTVKTLVSFNGLDGGGPRGSLIMDAKGDLFGTTNSGSGVKFPGTVFEITKTATGYASSPKTLISFNGLDGYNPQGSLIADATGDLFGTTNIGGAHGAGTVFEIAKTTTGYAAAPTALVSFTGSPSGALPAANLIADAKGDLFGTTTEGGAHDHGTVFEIARTATGYASTPTTLVSFAGGSSEGPIGGLIMDAKGDLLGTTAGASVYPGTVFEIAKTSTGYAGSVKTLVTFNAKDGAHPYGSLIADAKGNLYGTTFGGGANNDGTVFKIAKTATGYSSTPTMLASFNGTNGAHPEGSLNADAEGDLFGTTARGGGPQNDGTAFEVTGSGFVVSATAGASSSGVFQLTGRSSLEAGAVLGSNTKPRFLSSSADGKSIIERTADNGNHTGPISYTAAGNAIDLNGLASSAMALTDSTSTHDVQIAGSGSSSPGALLFQNPNFGFGLGTFHTASAGTGDSLIAHG